MKCPNCGSALSADARFCGECGQALQQLGKSLVEKAPAAVADSGPDLSGLHTIDGAETKSPRGSSTRVLAPGDVFAARYEVTQVVGEGGMGVVYRAKDKLVEKDVALKLIRADRLAGADAVKRLIREGVTSRDIRHPNVVAVYDVGESDGQPYMSMEFLAGQSLRGWTRKRLSASQDCSMVTAACVISEILAGLDAAHRAGVVHRDLKPENVMLTREPTDAGASLKILDFGVARAAGSGDTGATSLGTRGYMAPEQITAPDAAAPSADLYSLSVMFYELLVGVVPQGHWQPPSGGRSDVPPAVDKLIERGLSNNPRQRPQNVAEYGRALAEAMLPYNQPNAPWGANLSETLFRRWGVSQDKPQPAPRPAPQPMPQPAPDRPAPAPQPLPLSGQGGKSWGQQWQWIKAGFTANFFNGKGRASRMEYWSILVAAVVIGVIGFAVDYESLSSGVASGTISFNPYQSADAALSEIMSSGQWFPVGSLVAALAALPPALSVTSRRLHDLGLNGWIAIATLVPTLGQFVSIGLGLPAGKADDNQYGPNPLGVPA